MAQKVFFGPQKIKINWQNIAGWFQRDWLQNIVPVNLCNLLFPVNWNVTSVLTQPPRQAEFSEYVSLSVCGVTASQTERFINHVTNFPLNHNLETDEIFGTLWQNWIKDAGTSSPVWTFFNSILLHWSMKWSNLIWITVKKLNPGWISDYECSMLITWFHCLFLHSLIEAIGINKSG